MVLIGGACKKGNIMSNNQKSFVEKVWEIVSANHGREEAYIALNAISLHCENNGPLRLLPGSRLPALIYGRHYKITDDRGQAVMPEHRSDVRKAIRVFCSTA